MLEAHPAREGAWFAETGFAELAFDSPGIGSYAVGSNELRARATAA